MTGVLGLRLPAIAAIVGAYLLAGAAWFVVHPPDASVTMDDGAYALAVAQLREGTWELPYPAARADPDGVAYPYPNAERSDEGYFPYVRQPAWVLALHVGDVLGGAAGMRLLVVAVAGLAVAVTAALARVAGDPSSGVLAAALVALSPLAFNGLQLWAHATGALGLAVLMVGATRSMEAELSAGNVAMAVAGAAVASLARADAGLFALAAGVVVVAVGCRRRQWSLCGVGVLIGATAAAAQLSSAMVAGRLTGGAGSGAATDPRGAGGLVERLQPALGTVLSTASSTAGYGLTLVGVLAVAGAVVLWRRGDPRAGVVLMTIAAIAWAVRLVAATDELATGLLGAWPVALVLALGPWSSWSDSEKRLLAVVLIGAVAVLATQYDVGGGANWGGRFLSSALPLLAVLVASRLVRAARCHGREGSRFVAATLVVAALTTAASLALDSYYRIQTDERVEEVAAMVAGRWVVTSSRALPNLAWRTADEVRWLRVPSRSDGGADRLRVILADLGVQEVLAYRVDDSALRALRRGGGSTAEPLTIQVEP